MNKKFKVILASAILFIICLVFCIRMTAASQAREYINQKYGDIISLQNLAVKSTITKIGFPHIIDRAWPVFFEYDGMDFQVDILNKSDTFAEKYMEQEYILRLMSEYKGNKIRLINMPYIQTHQGISYPIDLDNLFFLEVTFDSTVDTVESFSNETEMLLSALKRTGLSNCDTLEAFANIEDKTMHIRVSPNDGPTAEEIAGNIVEFPLSDFE